MSTVLGAQSLRTKTVLAKDPPISRIIVGLGNYGTQYMHQRSNIGYRVGYELMAQCKVEEKDIHDPHDPYSDRSNNRRSDGENREKALHGGSNSRKLYRDMFKTRHGDNSWCTEWFKDYHGVWCSRIVLGNFGSTSSCSPSPHSLGGTSPRALVGDPQTHRTGLLLPQTMYAHSGDALKLVLQSYKQIKPPQILVVSDDISLCLGTSVLCQAGELNTPSTAKAEGIAANNHEPESPLSILTKAPRNEGVAHIARTLGDVFGEEEAAASLYWLRVGTQLYRPPGRVQQESSGILAEVNDNFNEIELGALRQRILPMSSFVCGLWAYSPMKAQHYLVNRIQRGLAQEEHHQQSLSSGGGGAAAKKNPHQPQLTNVLDPFQPALPEELKVWSSVSKGMLNFRDSAILQASVNGDRLPKIRDPHFNANETRRISENLAREEAEKRQRRN